MPAETIKDETLTNNRLQNASTGTIVLLGLLVTSLAFPESWKGWPYAPFPIFHALLAIAIPIWFKCVDLSNPAANLRTHGKTIVVFAGLALVFIGIYVGLYSALLGWVGRSNDPAWSLLATYRLLGKLYIDRYGEAPVMAIGYIFVGVWPMFGEEFFYRAFLLQGLMLRMTPARAATLSSSLFGLRHALQLSYLLPAYPIASGIAYFIWAAGFGVIWSIVYYRTRSLWPCMLIHSANFVLAPFIFLILKP
jgi:membrane protease YdiL (CAAX protease family)